MSQTISSTAAWVFQHGAMAHEILFRDVEEEGELPGITIDERATIEAMIPELRSTWIGVLTAARSALWRLSEGHRSHKYLQRSVHNQDGTIWAQGYFSASPGPGLIAGVSLEVWDDPTYNLYVWLEVDPSRRGEVEVALGDHEPNPVFDEDGTVFLTLPAPHEGETFQAAGERAAAALWGMVQRVG
jgi:hypothetical protein